MREILERMNRSWRNIIQEKGDGFESSFGNPIPGDEFHVNISIFSMTSEIAPG